MKKSLFAGLSVLEPGEPISDENGAFAGVDRESIDRLLELGAKTHRHTGTNGVAAPSATASGGLIASGGSVPASTTISIGYTFEDGARGETTISPLAAISTPGAVEAPPSAPIAKVSTASGNLLVNTYYYALTFTDGGGGETPLGAAVAAQRQPGFPSSQVELSGLNNGLVAAGAAGWRLYRAVGGGAYNLLATGGPSEATFIDDGTHSLDCSTHPPAGSENTTQGVSQLTVTLPNVPDPSIAFINVYASITGDFSGGSLLGRFPSSSGGRVAVFKSLELGTTSPPPVNRSIGGAHQIDPDTELLEWHWKRPVVASGALGSGTLGDVRLVESTGSFYGVLASGGASAAPGWTKLASAGGGAGGSIAVIASGLTVSPAEELELIGSGGIAIKHTEPKAKKSAITLEGDAAQLANEGMGVLVLKTSEKGITRPTKFKQYTWYCKEKPTNMREFDIWIEEGP